jgi:hypothetical protein
VRRLIVCVLLSIPLTACTMWQAQEVTPQTLVPSMQPGERVRVTLSDGSWVILSEPTISGDSLLGTIEEGEYQGQPLQGGGWTGIPLDEVVEVALRRTAFSGTVDVERLSADSYPPIPPGDVTVFSSPDELGADTIQYEEIAVIVTRSSSGRPALVQMSVDEAARLGANSMVIQRTRTYDHWLVLIGGLPSWEMTSMAIRWATIPPRT